MFLALGILLVLLGFGLLMFPDGLHSLLRRGKAGAEATTSVAFLLCARLLGLGLLVGGAFLVSALLTGRISLPLQ